ncbi:MAG TPA: triose-phosphate isomerase [Chthonomonadales bacterium]|nr:triose-phosphate isomerase [Chthonomonadales bacterium]
MRRKIVAGNWKMNGNCADAVRLIAELKPLLADRPDVETLVCPPYTSLAAARDALVGSQIGLGAQNLFWKPRGAYTGQISAEMLTKLNVRYVIVGHSEARGRFGVPESDFDEELLRYFGDTDASVNRKLHAALANGLIPICCVGETIAERRAGMTEAIVTTQTERALAGIEAAAIPNIAFAYEPVWAIGTGEVCEAGEADRVCGLIRSVVERLFGMTAADRIRIQYGGSVKPDNAAELLAQPNIDGALVGGASLKAADFAAIVHACPSPP